MKAIVTGHSRGLGAAIAEELLARGIPVLGMSRQSNAALAERHPTSLTQCALDLTDGAALAHWLERSTLRSYLAGCETVLLINNAGTLQPVGPLTAQTPEAIARAVALNVAAPMMLAAAIVAASPQARERRILHVSSGAARSPYAGWSVYCATKAALDHHARAVALDATPGVQICSLAPGVIDTDMQAEIRASAEEDFPLKPRFEALQRDGALLRPADCAARLVDCLLRPDFGMQSVADLRELSA